MAKKLYLKPGWAVVGDIGVSSCCTYSRTERKEEIKGDGLIGNWHTHKEVTSILEEKGVFRARRNARKLLRKVGAFVSGFGYLCPTEKKDELEKALKEVNKHCTEYNSNARCTSLRPNLVVFEFRPEDEQVAAMLYGQATECLNQILMAIEKGDISKLRDWAGRATGLTKILPSESAQQLAVALTIIRKNAKEAVKATKGLEEESRMVKIAKMLNASPIQGVRAQFVEVEDSIAEWKCPQLSPVMDRAVE